MTTSESADAHRSQTDDTGSPEDAGVVSLERQLALTDQVIGLEAQLAEVRRAGTLPPSEILGAEHRLAELRGTLTWRLGRVAVAPIRAAQRIAHRRRGSGS